MPAGAGPARRPRLLSPRSRRAPSAMQSRGSSGALHRTVSPLCAGNERVRTIQHGPTVRWTLGAPVGAVGVGAFWPSAQGRGLQGSGPLEHRYRYLRLDARVEKVRALAHVVRERLVVAHDRASWAGWSSKNSRTAFSTTASQEKNQWSLLPLQVGGVERVKLCPNPGPGPIGGIGAARLLGCYSAV